MLINRVFIKKVFLFFCIFFCFLNIIAYNNQSPFIGDAVSFGKKIIDYGIKQKKQSLGLLGGVVFVGVVLAYKKKKNYSAKIKSIEDRIKENFDLIIKRKTDIMNAGAIMTLEDHCSLQYQLHSIFSKVTDDEFVIFIHHISLKEKAIFFNNPEFDLWAYRFVFSSHAIKKNICACLSDGDKWRFKDTIKKMKTEVLKTTKDDYVSLLTKCENAQKGYANGDVFQQDIKIQFQQLKIVYPLDFNNILYLCSKKEREKIEKIAQVDIKQENILKKYDYWIKCWNDTIVEESLIKDSIYFIDDQDWSLLIDLLSNDQKRVLFSDQYRIYFAQKFSLASEDLVEKIAEQFAVQEKKEAFLSVHKEQKVFFEQLKQKYQSEIDILKNKKNKESEEYKEARRFMIHQSIVNHYHFNIIRIFFQNELDEFCAEESVKEECKLKYEIYSKHKTDLNRLQDFYYRLQCSDKLNTCEFKETCNNCFRITCKIFKSLEDDQLVLLLDMVNDTNLYSMFNNLIPDYKRFKGASLELKNRIMSCVPTDQKENCKKAWSFFEENE